MKLKATAKDTKPGTWVYIKVQGKFQRVKVVESKSSPKGTKVVYEMENGQTGQQLLTALYRHI
jgi:hypothetical protein